MSDARRHSTGTALGTWFTRHKAALTTIAFAHAVARIEAYLFDWLLYGTVAAVCAGMFGPVLGSLATFAAMAPLSAVICLGYVRLYDWSKKDWLGLEALKSLRDSNTGDGWFRRALLRVLRLGQVPTFLLLSIYTDPFVTVLFFRNRRRAYDGLTERDWRIFWASVVVCNASWTFQLAAVIEVARFLWRHFHESLVLGG